MNWITCFSISELKNNTMNNTSTAKNNVTNEGMNRPFWPFRTFIQLHKEQISCFIISELHFLLKHYRTNNALWTVQQKQTTMWTNWGLDCLFRHFRTFIQLYKELNRLFSISEPKNNALWTIYQIQTTMWTNWGLNRLSRLFTTFIQSHKELNRLFWHFRTYQWCAMNHENILNNNVN